ncbi:response regulator transcription factor [Oceanithermus sp.]|uniref:response regulator transcription factor n=1 Tax=Oceanithermus sp. TaxID=2268145 RepID=UPI0025F28419|nr:response regulator transcription factor [Oceanithermus sp.]
MSERVLVVDDDPNLLRLVEANLRARGYEVDAVASGEAALERLRERGDHACVLLDLMLPGLDGLEVIREVRAFGDVPVVVMSALGEEERKVRALDLGADDYLVKPFGVAELLARVRAAIRRYGVQPRPDAPRVGALELDPGGGYARVAGRRVRLSPMEYAVLRQLVLARGRTLRHEELLDAVWGRGAGEDHYLHVYVGRLRRKLGEEVRIESLPGVGYRLDVEDLLSPPDVE